MHCIIGIYKIPALWDRIDNFQQDNSQSLKFIYKNDINSFREHKNRVTSIMDNIYFKIFIALVEKSHCNNAHYIFIDEGIDNNIKMNIFNINIWILRKYSDLLHFIIIWSPKKLKLYFIPPLH